MKIEFSTDTAAFEETYREAEVIRILKKIQEDIWNCRSHGSIMDINGNKIGSWKL